MNSLRTNNRLKAFTLLELLVGMVVSGIVLGAMFSAYHIVVKQANVYLQRTKINEELSLLHGRLVMDFQNDSLACQFGQSPETGAYNDSENPVIYEFPGSYTLRRRGEHTDTFFVSIVKCQTFFNGEPMNNPEDDVDEVRLTVKTGEMNEDILLSKKLDARTRLKNKNHIGT